MYTGIHIYTFKLLTDRWLQYHDRDTGDLCGMLPLAIGMKVALTEHLDRPKNLLKGSIGRVHSWVWQDNDRLPSAVYVAFPNAEWKLDGVETPGVYPILPKQKDWYLDARRDNPVLKIKRRQIPLTPAYAMTAHASQGKTLPAVLLDLNVDKKVDPTFGTVAASRVRSREDCLILRPFPHFLFNKGMPEGPGLLLKTLRGEIVDWPAYREGRVPTATCCGCWELLPFDAFDYHQWERVRANDRAKCLGCKVPGGNAPKRRKIDSGSQKHICDGCKITKVEEAFPRAQLQQDEAASSVAGAKLTTSNVANARPLLPCTAGSGRTWPRCPRHGSPVRHAKMKHSRRLRDPGNTQNGSNAVAVARCSQPHPSPAGKMTSNSNAA